jgi:hypothetical protein
VRRTSWQEYTAEQNYSPMAREQKREQRGAWAPNIPFFFFFFHHLPIASAWETVYNTWIIWKTFKIQIITNAYFFQSFPCFFCSSFNISGLTLKSLIQLKLIFIQGER